MIDPILEDEISRIGTHQTIECYDKNPDPQKRIATRSTSTYDRERETIFSIVVIERVSNMVTPELLREEPSNMCRDGRLADGTRDTDDVRLMSRDDESSQEREYREDDMLHI
jgi:hypothetical protein